MKRVPLYPHNAPPPEERDKILGTYIDAWDALDQHVKQVFGALLTTPHEIAKLMLNMVRETNRLSEMMSLLGKLRFHTSDQTTLDRLLGRFETQADRRNRIIHGHWYHVQGVPHFRGDDRYGGKWVRIYDPPDKEVFRLITTPDIGGTEHARARAKYAFDIPRLITATAVCRNLTNDWNVFSISIRQRTWPETIGQAPPLWPKLPPV